ncbi:MAG: hypothetical protein JRG91_11980 [Deltaproteobacteria bacterium]|nr:hypothetical protein [Deltaproteobacteria bacterium]
MEDVLDREGWEFRFTASDPRLTEHVEEFRALGFDVHLEKLGAHDAPDASCSTCLEDRPVFAIYVRRSG